MLTGTYSRDRAEGSTAKGKSMPEDHVNNTRKMKIGRRYQTSKLIQLYAVRELAKMRPSTETGVTINFASHGLCNTGLTRHVGLAPTIIIGTMRVILGRTAEEGSRVLLYAAIAGKESHGKYLSECEIREQVYPSQNFALCINATWQLSSRAMDYQ